MSQKKMSQKHVEIREGLDIRTYIGSYCKE